MMSLGKPVVVTDSAESADYPYCGVLRVTAGVAEAEELFDHMVLVTEFPGIAREIGAAARRHIRNYHGLESVVKKYWNALCSAVSLPS